MNQPPDGPFHVPIDAQALDRLHRFARAAARRMPAPSDPVLAEFVREVGEGRARPRDLLLSGHYDQVIEPVLRRAVDKYNQLSPEERAALIADGESKISELLDQQSDDGNR